MLGHGVNLPCETLLFAESQKFDGEERRDLHALEIAQIAGRAGASASSSAATSAPAGIVWANADPDLIESALHPHVPLPGGLGYRVVDTAGSGRGSRIADRRPAQPRRRFAPGTRPRCASGRPTAGSRSSRSAAARAARRRAAAAARRGRHLSLEQVWKLVNAPVDEDNAELLGTLALAVAGDRATRPVLQWLLDVKRLRDATLEDAEQAARTASILRWFALQYTDVGGVTLEKAAELEEAASRRVSEKLAAEVRSPSVGRRKQCLELRPWFALCERCYGRR